YLLLSFLQWLPIVINNAMADAGLSPTLVRLIPGTISIFGMLVVVVLWLVIALTWLLPPALVAEEFSLGSGLLALGRLIRANVSGVLLAEMLTVAVGVLIAAPIYYLIDDVLLGEFPLVLMPARFVVKGLAWTGFLAFMAVANVFIYLDVKYEQS